MRWAEVQQSLEEFVQGQWTATALQFENSPFDSELYNEYVQLYVVFGASKKIALAVPNYRQVGLLIMDIKVKPSTGSVRALQLANAAADMMRSVVVGSTPPLVAPKVHLLTPELFKSDKEDAGWVRYQVHSPFYYDLES